MDIFGFKTQGVYYDKFRPTYPQKWVDHCLKTVKGKNKYLDIATGTGQLLFAFAPHFNASKGIDISKNMIQSASGKLDKFKEENNNCKVELVVGGVTEINEIEKYDLITVGQALHFFPIEDSLKKISTMLSEGGRFVTFGYIAKRVTSKNQNEAKIFDSFYGKVKPLFTFDRNELHTHYSDKDKYPFDKIFPSVEREVMEVPLQMNKLEYLSYLKTMSGYNIYKQKNEDDPIQEVDKDCAEEVTVWLDYFRIQCGQK